MDGTERMLFLLHILVLSTNVCGKHLPGPPNSQRKLYSRQMIIPNKFIPILKGSAMFKSRSSSTDLSNFLKPKSHEHDSETGQTRQNLMNSLGMDSSQLQGGGAGDTNVMGGIGEMGGIGDMTRTVGISEMGATGGIGGTGGDGGTGGFDESGGMTGMPGPRQMVGMNDQMNIMNRIGGMGNSDASQAPLESNMGGDGMNPFVNGGGDAMKSEGESPPAGDPMGTLKDMLSAQGTNAALGANSEAFGPGGAVSSNVLAMLNQIVGKEMPSESPVDPSSRAEQLWDQLQNNFNAQKPSGVPYIDSESSKQSATSQIRQDSLASDPSHPTTVANQQAANTSMTPTRDPSRPNLPAEKPSTSNPLVASSTSTNLTSSNPSTANFQPNNPSATNPTSTSNSNSKPHSQNETHKNSLTEATSSLSEIDAEENQPLSADMIKFLKGVKFVISQEPGNDIILGKKFSSDEAVDVGSTELKEGNGVMKNIVSASDNGRANGGLMFSQKNKESSINNLPIARKEYGIKTTVTKKKISSFTKSLQNQDDAKNKDFAEYMKAAKVLRSASKKLRDPLAKKSTDIAIASILKVVALGDNKPLSSSNPGLLNGGDVNDQLSEKYIEAARVLGTASRKLADQVAKQSTEIGIASILKVIALGKYPTAKKTFVPQFYRLHSPFDQYLNATDDEDKERRKKISNGIVEAIKQTLKQRKSMKSDSK